MLLSHEPSPEFLPYKLLAHAKECVFSLKNLIPIQHSANFTIETSIIIRFKIKKRKMMKIILLYKR